VETTNRLRYIFTKSIVVLSVILLSLLVGFLQIRGPILAILLLAPFAGLFIVLYPKVGLYVILVSTYTFDWLSRVLGVLPTQARWLPDIVLALLIIPLVYRLLFKEKQLQKTPIDWFFLGILVVGAFSTFINGVSIVTALSGFRAIITPFILFYLLINLNFSERDLKNFCSFYLGFELIQIPLTIIQVRFVWGWRSCEWNIWLLATGIATVVCLNAHEPLLWTGNNPAKVVGICWFGKYFVYSNAVG